MFSKALVVLALCASALAIPTRGGLTVAIQAPKNVASIAELTVVAAVTNTGAEDVKIMNIGTVLDSRLPTKSFTVSRNGTEVSFTGVKLSLNLEKLSADAYTVIPAGKTVSVVHNIAALFDFENAGVGAFSIEPVNHIPVVASDSNATAVALQPYQLSTSKHDFRISKDVAKRSLPQQTEKRAFLDCPDAASSDFISASYTEGTGLASLASSYISGNGADALFGAYFKESNPGDIINVFNNVYNEAAFGNRALSCSDPDGICASGDVIAYTHIPNGDVFFCGGFFSMVSSTDICAGADHRNIRGAVTLHELTHATSGTTDIGYGCDFDQSLAAGDAIRNADNYNCFSVQVFQDTQC
ncbi:zincin [Exidia glandulosa HHB12029]|uniref:Neutral protease 2 n=1 Tax=Exidia glandulosa HHB12029 TaxID=1314781 RepID=A0A165ML61_EXIGL|nr:zincin [Exidia glandulosa HHB12029]